MVIDSGGNPEQEKGVQSGRDTVDSSPTPTRRPPALWAQVLSLCATAAILWFTRFRPRLRHVTLEELIAQAIGFSLLVWLWAAAIAIALFLTIPRAERRESIAAALRTSATAVWFAPAILLVSGLNPPAIAAAMVLVVSASRLLYSEWLLIYPPEPPLPYYGRGMFGSDEPPPQPFLSMIAPSFALALCLQLGLLALLLNLRLLAAFLLVMGAALVTMSAIGRGALAIDPQPSIPRAIFGAFMTVLLSAGLTVGGLSHRILNGGGYPDRDQPGGAAEAPSNPPNATPAGMGFPGDYPGVILWPEVRPYTTLVAPELALKSPLTGTERPYRIPFAGEYWMYRWPFRRPPRNSSIQTGSPTALSFATPDRYPLQMEAHQRLLQPFDPRCCRTMKVEVLNADRYPGTVSLSLYAVGSDQAEAPVEKWGTARVLSAPDPATPVRETLQFNIPRESAITTCTELKFVFERAPVRAHKSARVAIEAFVLLP